jgi:hypothetical protein
LWRAYCQKCHRSATKSPRLAGRAPTHPPPTHWSGPRLGSCGCWVPENSHSGRKVARRPSYGIGWSRVAPATTGESAAGPINTSPGKALFSDASRTPTQLTRTRHQQPDQTAPVGGLRCDPFLSDASGRWSESTAPLEAALDREGPNNGVQRHRPNTCRSAVCSRHHPLSRHPVVGFGVSVWFGDAYRRQ